MFVIVLFAFVSACHAGVIPQESYPHHGQATSYQHVKIENYHPVPVYLKKEHSHLLEHPVAKGHTATSLQVHHGGEHDHGYALASGTHQQFQGHDFQGHHLQGQDLGGYEQGHQELGGHEQLGGQQQYEGQEQLGGHHQQVVVAQHEEQQHEGGADLGHYDTGADLSGHGLQAYATQDAGDYGHGGQETAGYEQEAAGYEHTVEDAHHHGHHYQ